MQHFPKFGLKNPEIRPKFAPNPKFRTKNCGKLPEIRAEKCFGGCGGDCGAEGGDGACFAHSLMSAFARWGCSVFWGCAGDASVFSGGEGKGGRRGEAWTEDHILYIFSKSNTYPLFFCIFANTQQRPQLSEGI